MNEYVEVNYNIYTTFLFMGHAFWKESIENRVKVLESNILNCSLMADLCKKRS